MNYFKKHPIAKRILYIFAGMLMIAHASRMIYQGVFQPHTSYVPNTFDLFFDWATLLVLGTIVFILSLNSFYRKYSQVKKEEKPPDISIT